VEDRVALNEALFREVNERLTDVLAPSPNQRIDFLCECGDEGCTELITLTQWQYEDLRGDPRLSVVVYGHATLAVEHVVAIGDGYQVVRKHPIERNLAKQTDPRSREPRRQRPSEAPGVYT